MASKETYNSVLEILSNHKQKDSFVEVEDKIISYKESFFKKDPKSLNTVIVKKIFTEKDSLSLILKGHLYIEVLLNDIIETDTRCQHKTLKRMYELLDSTFYNKIAFLREQDLLEDILYSDIDALNRYRNKFAHNFEFNICSLTIFDDFSLFKEIQVKQKRKKIENEALFRYAIRYAYMYTFDRLYKKFDFLLALKKDNKRAPYHPLESI